MKEITIKIGLCMVALISVVVLFTVVAYVFFSGMSIISLDFLLTPPTHGGTKGGIFPQIIGSLSLLSVCLLFSIPLGVASGIYLAEYAPENILTKSISFFCGVLSRNTLDCNRVVWACLPRSLSWTWYFYAIRRACSWFHDPAMDS